MNKPIARVWKFASESSPEKTYETLQFSDGTTSCACPGWTRRVAVDGSRSCKHTRLVHMSLNLATAESVSFHEYASGSRTREVPVPQPRGKRVVVSLTVSKPNQRKFDI